MANTIITPTALLNESGRLFHQKAKFIGATTRKYDDQFAQTGAKVGATINLRDRNAFTVTKSATLNVQNVVETYQTLTANKRYQIGMDFTSQDLTLSMDEFSPRYIEPAIAKIVASVEADYISDMRNAVANVVDNDTAAFSYLNVAQAKQRLDENLAPEDGKRKLFLCPTHATKYLDASKGFYNPSAALGEQYGSGIVKDITGFDVMGTTHLTTHATGTAAKVTGYTVNGATQSGATITIQTGTTTFKVGDVVTFANCYEVHPETKVSYGYLKQFTVTADLAAAGALSISPSLVPSGAKQNCSGYPDNTGAVVKVGAGASEVMTESLVFHPDAFIFASVDLEDMSKYGGWGARKAMDGISMRIWRQGDIVNDSAPCRLDFLGGWLARYPQLACRIHADG